MLNLVTQDRHSWTYANFRRFFDLALFKYNYVQPSNFSLKSVCGKSGIFIPIEEDFTTCTDIDLILFLQYVASRITRFIRKTDYLTT